MPGRASKVCTYAGCTTLTSHRDGRCPSHPHSKQWTRYTLTPQRTSGRTNQKQRAALFKRQPTCQQCEREGRVTLATIRDHIVPLAEGGSDDVSNTQALCKTCHDIKSKEEAKRGRDRNNDGQQASSTPIKQAHTYSIA